MSWLAGIDQGAGVQKRQSLEKQCGLGGRRLAKGVSVKKLKQDLDENRYHELTFG